MSKREHAIAVRRMVYRIYRENPAALKAAFDTNDSSSAMVKLCKKEAAREGLTEDEIKKVLLSGKFLALLKQEIENKEDIFDSLENFLDMYIFEPIYKYELGDSLDAKLQEKMDSLRISDKKMPIDDVLKIPKVTLGIMGIAAGVYALSVMSTGIHLKSVFHTAFAHDIFRVSCNCYVKTYRVKSVRAMQSNTSLASVIYDAVSSVVSSAVLGKASDPAPQYDKYFSEINTDILLSGTIFGHLRALYRHWISLQTNNSSDSNGSGKPKAD